MNTKDLAIAYIKEQTGLDVGRMLAHRNNVVEFEFPDTTDERRNPANKILAQVLKILRSKYKNPMRIYGTGQGVRITWRIDDTKQIQVYNRMVGPHEISLINTMESS